MIIIRPGTHLATQPGKQRDGKTRADVTDFTSQQLAECRCNMHHVQPAGRMVYAGEGSAGPSPRNEEGTNAQENRTHWVAEFSNRSPRLS